VVQHDHCFFDTGTVASAAAAVWSRPGWRRLRVERSGWAARVTAGEVRLAVPAVLLELVVEADAVHPLTPRRSLGCARLSVRTVHCSGWSPADLTSRMTATACLAAETDRDLVGRPQRAPHPTMIKYTYHTAVTREDADRAGQTSVDPPGAVGGDGGIAAPADEQVDVQQCHEST
jgi:hypothetical protein